MQKGIDFITTSEDSKWVTLLSISSERSRSNGSKSCPLRRQRASEANSAQYRLARPCGIFILPFLIKSLPRLKPGTPFRKGRIRGGEAGGFLGKGE